MKKTFIILLLVVSVLTMSTPAAAIDGSEAAAVVSTAEAVEGIYEVTVISRMFGRAGASTVTGAKGIAFEVVESDVQNIVYRITNGLSVTLSENSIDALADLVVKDSNGNVEALLQCKDGVSDSYINEMIRAVKAGKYDGAELVGTKEFAEKFNAKAASAGITQRVTDSGVSTKLTSKIADKALCIAPTASRVLSDMLKTSAVAMAITIPISVSESIIRGDDFFEAAGNVIVDLGISGASAATAPAASAGVTLLLCAAGASPVGTAVCATVVGIMVPVGCGYALYRINNKYGIEEKITETARITGDHIQTIAQNAAATIVEYNIPDKATTVYYTALDSITDAWTAVTVACEDIANWSTKTWNNTGRFLTGLFSKA